MNRNHALSAGLFLLSLLVLVFVVLVAGSSADTGTAAGAAPPSAGIGAAAVQGTSLAVTAVNPNHGPAAGGNTVVITGTGFPMGAGIQESGSLSVYFGSSNNTVPEADVRVDSPTQITVVAPAGTAGATVNVRVVVGRNMSPNTPADDYTYDASSGTSSGGTSGTTSGGTTGATSGATGQQEIQRRLSLPPFVYVGELNHAEGSGTYTGAAAFIDSATDTLAGRPTGGKSLNGVAVSPDGSLVYMTDFYKPVLCVFNAETMKKVREISLPGVKSRAASFPTENAFLYSAYRPCAAGVACTPDGRWVLVCTSAGLEVVDAAKNKVVRTLSALPGGAVAVSFDGKRAYVASDNFNELSKRSLDDWLSLTVETGDCRLAYVDLETWEVVKTIPTGMVAGLAVKPDDSQVLFSEFGKQRVRAVDAVTLEDLWTVDTAPAHPIGLAFVPDGTKAYAVCAADTGYFQYGAEESIAPIAPRPKDYYCLVIGIAAREIVKKIYLVDFQPQAIAVQADGRKAYLTGGNLPHAVVLDTVDDERIGQIGEEVVRTAGVAVRPFWWSAECLEALGLGAGSAGGETTTTAGGSTTTVASGGTTSTAGGATTTAAGGGATETSAGGSTTTSGGVTTGGGEEGGEGGLATGWIILIIVLAAIAVVALALFFFLLGRRRR